MEHPGCSMLTRILHRSSKVQEIATSPPLRAAPRNDTVMGPQVRRFQQLAKLQFIRQLRSRGPKDVGHATGFVTNWALPHLGHLPTTSGARLLLTSLPQFGSRQTCSLPFCPFFGMEIIGKPQVGHLDFRIFAFLGKE